jgi:uncharacterized C2H2 Zn-finger protein
MATETRTKVVTWQDSRGNTIDVCPQCEAKFRAKGEWPKHPGTGEEYAQVHRGLHVGICDYCSNAE